jgi:hypothetical protein
MKSYHAPAAILLICCFVVSFPIFSQVGINTTNPRVTLEIAGDVKVSGNLEITSYKDQEDNESSTFLLQEPTDQIKSIDVSNPTGAALGYIQEYIIVNPNKDWVKDFDTGIDATDFTLVPISSVYDTDLALRNAGNIDENYSLPYCASYVDGGTWHMIADYPMVANVNNQDDGIWKITTLIFSNDLAKQFGTNVIPMNSTTTGSAVTPIID